MSFAMWALVIGTLLVTMALAGSMLKRLPASASMFYLAVGYGLGTADWGPMPPDPQGYAAILERVSEVALLISLFSVGLKLGLPLSNRQWYLPVRLAFVSMALTVVRHPRHRLHLLPDVRPPPRPLRPARRAGHYADADHGRRFHCRAWDIGDAP